ncbi:hypothetical protein BJX70DRAFT_378390 [Aspergillus crustosus]
MSTASSSVSIPLASKRRKIRKGTTSCWDCKRRKVRCSLVENSVTPCVACRRRGTSCITQDHPDAVEEEESRVGSVSGQHVDTVQDIDSTPSREPNARTSPHTHPTTSTSRTAGRTPRTTSPVFVLVNQTSRPSALHPHAKISEELYASLPLPKDVDLLLKSGAHVSISLHGLTMTPSPELEYAGDDGVNPLLARPTVDSHPVKLATYLFHMATALQHLDFKTSGKELMSLSGPSQYLMMPFAETAIRLVTSNNDLVGTSVEGLECVMMEGNYHLNCGNLQPAWIAYRRVMSLAQLMGIHRPSHPAPRLLDPQHKANTAYLWHRIVYTDRMLCLLMGLPPATFDRNVAADAVLSLDTPIGRLDRMHSVIASRILKRHDSDPTSFSLDTVREIDSELQRATETMPSGWWVAPTLTSQGRAQNNTTKTAAINDMHRLSTQLTHYALINYLHIPLMLKFTSANSNLQAYSQTSCITASREIISRHTIFRAFNRIAYSSRLLDFFTISAVLLLLVAHLQQHARSQSPGELNPMLHQRQTDRAMAEQAVKDMQAISWVSLDSVTAKAADMLGKLLVIEAEARTGGGGYRAESVRGEEGVQAAENQGDSTDQDTSPGTTNQGLRFCIPYFGAVRIVPDGTISRELEDGAQGFLNTPDISGGMQAAAQCLYGAAEDAGAHPPSAPWYTYPGLASGADDWVFQGLDTTFFDNWMRGPSIHPGDNTGFQHG